MALYLGLNQIVIEFTSTAISILFLVGTALALTANDCILLMIHLSYYSIAHQIRLLRARMTYNSKEDSPWKGSKIILTHLYEASAALESIISFPALYIITCKLVIVSLNLFAVIYLLMKSTTAYGLNWILLMLAQVVSSLTHVIIVLHAADMPVYQVSNYLKHNLRIIFLIL